MKAELLINNCKIVVNQTRTDGTPVIFIHGNSLSSKVFDKQLNNDLFKNYRLISFDLQGHGNSEKSKNPETQYCIQAYIETLLGVIKQLDLKNPIIVGHSLGGHIAINALNKITDIKALAIFGTPPFKLPPEMDKAYFPRPEMSLAFKPDLSNDEALALASVYCNNSKIAEMLTSEILKTDPLNREYLGKSMVIENFTDEVKILENFDKPIAIFHADNDVLVNPDYFNDLNIPTLWKNEIQIINNSGHSPQYENEILFNDILLDFLDFVHK